MSFIPYKNLNLIQKKMVETALKARRKAYAPYSNYWVGCAILDDKNKIHSGCNVENASYPAGLCAERVATVKMISEGGKEIKQLVLVGSSSDPVFPCGMCRQVIQEFGIECVIISVDSKKKKIKMLPFRELFPEGFTPEHLKK